MNDLFAPYPIALALKEIGFDERCMASYYTDIDENRTRDYDLRRKLNIEFIHNSFSGEEEGYIINKETDYYVAAPLYDQVIDWLYKEKKYSVEALSNPNGKWVSWLYDISKTHIGNGNFTYFTNSWCLNNERGYEGFSSRKEALDAGILKAIELIKQKK